MVTDLQKNPLEGLELGPKMLLCSERERIFVYALAVGLASNASDAARLAGYGRGSKKGLHVTASKIMHRKRVVEALEEVCKSHFRGLIPDVIAAARALVLDRKHPDHQKTVISLLSRLGFGERAGGDVTVKGDIQVTHTERAVEDLRALRQLGASREKLIEIFGEIGLSRYEKILDAEPIKVIEHQPAAPPGAVEEPQRGICD